MESPKKQVPVTQLRFCHDCRLRWKSVSYYTDYCPRCSYLPDRIELSWWGWLKCMTTYTLVQSKVEIDFCAFTDDHQPHI